MPVKVLKCISAGPHPNAHSLRKYLFENIISEDIVEVLPIVANMQNTYEVGDLVFVALEGTILKDGTTISKTKIRKEPSVGMALGKVPSLGEDCSHLFCEPEAKHADAGQVLITAGNDAVPRLGGAVTIAGVTGPYGATGPIALAPKLEKPTLKIPQGPTGLYGRDYSKKIEGV
jgi:tRNA-binding EMAP/Myf-like protein